MTSSSTTLVNLDYEYASKISLFSSQLGDNSAEADPFLAQTAQLIESKNFAGLMEKVLEKISFILSIENDAEIECFLQSVFSVIYTSEGLDPVPVINKVISAIAGASSKSTSKSSLKALIVVFNLAFDPVSKCSSLLALLTLAVANAQAAVVVHLYDHFDDWFSAWALEADSKRILLQRVIQLAESLGNPKGNATALNATIKYFKTFERGQLLTPDAEKLASTALVSAIKTNIVDFTDRNGLLEALSGHAFPEPLSSLLRLLTIICDGSLEDFESFQAVHKEDIFQAFKLDETQLSRNMKLLALCSLAAQAGAAASNKESAVVSFQAIQALLRVHESDVELWVIEGIADNLIEASIDQLNGVVHISRYAHRSFGPVEWKVVQQRLEALRSSITGILTTIKRGQDLIAM